MLKKGTMYSRAELVQELKMDCGAVTDKELAEIASETLKCKVIYYGPKFHPPYLVD